MGGNLSILRKPLYSPCIDHPREALSTFGLDDATAACAWRPELLVLAWARRVARVTPKPSRSSAQHSAGVELRQANPAYLLV